MRLNKFGVDFVNKPYPKKMNKFGVGFCKNPTLEKRKRGKIIVLCDEKGCRKCMKKKWTIFIKTFTCNYSLRLNSDC